METVANNPAAALHRGLDWHSIQLEVGQTVAGVVVRLPEPGAPRGNSLVLDTESEGTVALPATARKGHSVLERRLRELQVKVGDHVTVVYHGKRQTADGEREYRFYEVQLWASTP